MKTLLSLTVLFFCISLSGLTAGTSGVLTYEVIGETTINITDCETTASGSITIPATLEGLPVTRISALAFLNCASITGIVIPENVTSIGTNTFSGCSQLVRAVFKGNAPTVLSPIFDDAAAGFKVYYNDEATGFTTTQWNGYVHETYEPTFSFELIAGNSETVKITDYHYVAGVTEIDVPATIVGLPVTHIDSYTFQEQQLTTRISLPDTITHIGEGAFYECTGLTTFTIPSNVTQIEGEAFFDCVRLTSVYFEGHAPHLGSDVFDFVAAGFKIHYLPAYEQGFTDDDHFPWPALQGNLEEYNDLYSFEVHEETVTITDYPTTVSGPLIIPETIVGKPVTRIGEGAFKYCSGLTQVDLPDSLEIIEREAFESCTGLTNISIPGAVTSIGDGAFRGCTALSSLYFEGDVPTLGVQVFPTGSVGFTTPVSNSGRMSLDLSLESSADSSSSAPAPLDTRYPTSQEWTEMLETQITRSVWQEGTFPNITSGTQSTVSWNDVDGVTFDVYRSYTMEPGSWTLIHEDYSDPINGRMRITDRDPAPDGKAFYHVYHHPMP